MKDQGNSIHWRMDSWEENGLPHLWGDNRAPTLTLCLSHGVATLLPRWLLDHKYTCLWRSLTEYVACEFLDSSVSGESTVVLLHLNPH